MLPDLPYYVSALFFVCLGYVFVMLWVGFCQADTITGKRVTLWVIGCMLVWCLLQFFAGYAGFYRHYNEIPPRFALFIGVPLLALLGFVLWNKAALTYLKSIPLKWLLWLHVVRVPIELVLYACYLQGSLPEIMTFAGRNYDILAGLTAPLAAYFGAQRGILQKQHLLLWNFIGIGLLLNIVITAMLSAPFPFQQFGFSQPNIAVFYAPLVLLPAFIVPVVLFSHIIAIIKLKSVN